MSTEALIEAILHKDAGQVQRWLEAGVPQNQPLDSFGLTPLHYAVGHSNQVIIDILLASGANPYLADFDGLSAVDAALRLQDYDSLRRFLAMPPQISICSDEEYSTNKKMTSS